MQNLLSLAVAPMKQLSLNTLTSSIATPSNQKSNISVHIGNITISANTNAEISKNVASELEREIKKVLQKINSDKERRKY
jgi:hypothetical protein